MIINTSIIKININQSQKKQIFLINRTCQEWPISDQVNQWNRVEWLSPLLDWKNLGIEYSKVCQLALRCAYPDVFYGPDSTLEGEEEDFSVEHMMLPISVPASLRYKMSGIATPGDIGTLTKEVSPT